MTAAREVTCRTCYAKPGDPCRSKGNQPHPARVRRAADDELFTRASSVACPTCKAPAGEDCRQVARPHGMRLRLAARWADGAKWLSGLDRVRGLPVIPVESVQRNPGSPLAFLVSFRCPWCRRDHTHGSHVEDFGAAPTHRVAHCISSAESALWECGYFIGLPATPPRSA